MATTIPVKVIIEAIDNASKAFKTVGDNMNSVGEAMIAIGAAPTIALGLSTKAAIDFESSFAGVRKTVDASEAEFKALSNNLRGIAKVTPTTTDELNKIAELAGSLGITGVDNITKFTDTISKLSYTTDLMGEEGAIAFAQIANVMQEPIQSVDRMGSTVVDLGNKMVTTEREITNFAARIAGAGKIAGLNTREVFAIGAAMASVGVEAEAGGTAVQKVLLDINEAVIKGGGNLTTFAKTAGMSAKQFQKSWREDAGQTFSEFVQGLGKQGEKAIFTLQDLGLEDQRLVRSFLSLANAGELVQNSFDIANKSWDENNALSAEAAKRNATMSAQLSTFKNNIMDVAITIGTVMLPRMNEMLDKVTPLINRFAAFADKHPELIANMLAAGAAIGGFGVALVTVGTVVTKISAAITALQFLFTGLPAAWAAVGAAVAAIGWPIILIVGAIAAAVALLAIAWNKNWFDIQGKTQAVLSFISNLFQTWWPVIVNTFNNIKNSVINSVTSMISFIQAIPGAVSTFVNSVVSFIQAIPTAIQSAFVAAGAWLADFFIVQIPYAIGYAVGRLVRFVVEDIPNALVAAYNSFVQFATVDVPNAWNALVAFFTTTIPKMLADFVVWWSQMQVQAGIAWTNFKQSIIKILTDLVTNAMAKAQEMYTGLVEWFIKTKDDVIAGIINLPQTVETIFNDMKDKAVQKAKDMYNGVKEWIDKVIGFFGDIINKAGEAINKSKEAATAGFEAGKTGKRQFGGQVSASSPVLVGEAGAEMFVPSVAGRIVPNNQLGSGQGGAPIVFNINASMIINSPNERRSIAEALYKDLVALARSQNKTVAELMGA